MGEVWKFGEFSVPAGLPYARSAAGAFYIDDDGDLICDASWVPGDVVQELLRRHAEWAARQTETQVVQAE